MKDKSIELQKIIKELKDLYEEYDKVYDAYDLCEEGWDNDIILNLEPELHRIEMEIKKLEWKLNSLTNNHKV